MVSAFRPLDRQVSYALQTNGMALNEEWTHFLKENQFLVGLSVDGYRELHDHYRVDTKGEAHTGVWLRRWHCCKNLKWRQTCYAS